MSAKIQHESLERVFHSSARMAIVSALCAADKSGITFSELRDECALTDGNLNGHLAALTEGEIVKVKREIVGKKPRSTITITKTGVGRFSSYLDALQDALKAARSAMPAAARKAARPSRA